MTEKLTKGMRVETGAFGGSSVCPMPCTSQLGQSVSVPNSKTQS